MLFLVQKPREALARAFREAHPAAIPTTDQVSHCLGRGRSLGLRRLLVHNFERLAHHLGLGAACFSRDSLKQRCRPRIDPDV
jgi:hypothetical protein